MKVTSTVSPNCEPAAVTMAGAFVSASTVTTLLAVAELNWLLTVTVMTAPLSASVNGGVSQK